MADPVAGPPHHVMAEIRNAVTHEGALHLTGVLARRTRISVDTPHRGVASALAVADVTAGLLGWSPTQKAREIELYAARAERETSSRQAPDLQVTPQD